MTKTHEIKIHPRVSDHAVLRYMERTSGMDFDEIRKAILTPLVCDAIRAGAKRIHSGNMVYVVENYTIVTVLTEKMADKNKPRG